MDRHLDRAAVTSNADGEGGGASADGPLQQVEDLYRTGKVRELLQRSSNHRELSASAAERLAILEAMAQFDLGDAQGSIERLQSVLRSSPRNSTSKFDAAMALFLRLSDFQGPEQLLPALVELRQASARAGNAGALAALHLAVARFEGIRGHCSDAHRHLEVSRRVAAREQNQALLCSLDLVEGSLECVAGNLVRSRFLAEHCRQRAELAGYSKYLLGATNNLALVALYSGNSVQSRRYLDQLLPLTADITYVRFGAQDTLAQVELFEGRLRECQELMNECRYCCRSGSCPGAVLV